MEVTHKSGIYAIDALYYQPELASIHLIREGNRIAIVDTGTQYSVPQIEQALAQLNLSFANVDLVILTHIHLDHAGGASRLMALCENAQLVVHPKGARHMADPSKLIAGSTAVYGEKEFARLYGEINPIDADRIVQPEDGDILSLAGRKLEFIDTPGHANHHHCIIDHASTSVFTGDTLGVGYRALRSNGEAFVAPTTTPVQFNPEALHQSIDKVMSYQPERLILTHYSAVTPSTRMIASLHEQIDDFVRLTQKAAETVDSKNMANQLGDHVLDYLAQRCINEFSSISEELARQWLKLDAHLNAQGLAFWWTQRRTA